MSYAGLDTFFGGLEGVVGAPDPQSYEKMKEEHTEMPDSNQEFTTGCAHHHTHSPPLHSALSLPTFRNECP